MLSTVVALPVIVWQQANRDRSSSCSSAPLHNNAEEKNSAELWQKEKKKPWGFFCTCFIWRSQITHTQQQKYTALVAMESPPSPWPLLLCYVVWQMPPTFTAGQTRDGIDGCMSGALNCARAEGCGGGCRVGYSECLQEWWRVHLRTWQEVSFNWCQWEK